jgi:hypothetical protein
MMKGHIYENLSPVRPPVKMFSVVPNLISIKEQCQDQSCLFRKEDYRKKATTPRTVLGSSPGKDVFCTLVTNDVKHR